MEEINITSTSRTTAEAEPVVIRLKDTVRLVFIPTIVQNSSEPEACVKGVFVYQKKKKNNEWESIKEINLNALKSAEGVQLEIKSAELLSLLRKLSDLYKIYRTSGLPRGKTKFLKVTSQLEGIAEVTEEELSEYLELNNSAGITLFKKVANWLSKLENSDKILDSLESLDSENLKQLNVIIGLGNLKRSLNTWESFKTNPDEEFWQNELTNNSFILSQIFSFPVMLVQGKAYVGGKNLTNRGGNIVDFLYKNSLTTNAALIEIKTPETQLLGSKYRKVYSISKELSGSTIQVSNYANSLTIDFNNISKQSNADLNAFKPHCVVIIGNAGKELDNEEKRKSFELYRNNLKDVEIVTYDELFGKVHNFIELLETGC